MRCVSSGCHSSDADIISDHEEGLTIGDAPIPPLHHIERTVNTPATMQRVIDGFGVNSLIIGQVVAARVAADSERIHEGGDQARLSEAPILAYLHPGRFATIDRTLTFPFPAGMEK